MSQGLSWSKYNDGSGSNWHSNIDIYDDWYYGDEVSDWNPLKHVWNIFGAGIPNLVNEAAVEPVVNWTENAWQHGPFDALTMTLGSMAGGPDSGADVADAAFSQYAGDEQVLDFWGLYSPANESTTLDETAYIDTREEIVTGYDENGEKIIAPNPNYGEKITSSSSLVETERVQGMDYDQERKLQKEEREYQRKLADWEAKKQGFLELGKSLADMANRQEAFQYDTLGD